MNNLSFQTPGTIAATALPLMLTQYAAKTLPAASLTLQSTTINNNSNAQVLVQAGSSEFTVDPGWVKTIPHVAVARVDVLILAPQGGVPFAGQVFGTCSDAALAAAASQLAVAQTVRYLWTIQSKITLPVSAAGQIKLLNILQIAPIASRAFMAQGALLRHVTIHGGFAGADNPMQIQAVNARTSTLSTANGIAFGGVLDSDYSAGMELYSVNLEGAGRGGFDREGDNVNVQLTYSNALGQPLDIIYSLGIETF